MVKDYGRKFSSLYILFNIEKKIIKDSVFSPDTFIYSIADQNGFLIPQSKVNFVLNNKGEIFWPNPLTQLKVRCRMNILWV